MARVVKHLGPYRTSFQPGCSLSCMERQKNILLKLFRTHNPSWASLKLFSTSSVAPNKYEYPKDGFGPFTTDRDLDPSGKETKENQELEKNISITDEERELNQLEAPLFDTIKEESDYWDKHRPEVDKRLSPVFRGYNQVNEGQMTVPYAKHTWYNVKQIYGKYDENDKHSRFVIHPRMTIMRILRDPINLEMKAFDYWREKRDVDMCKAYQTYDIVRGRSLGDELYCAHFVVGIGGRVKFHGFKNWFDKDNSTSLPSSFAPEFIIEAIDLTDTTMLYEGMSFLVRLKDLRSLNLSKCVALEEWAIGRLHPLRNSLVHLDLSGCPRIPESAIASLWKFKNLKRLVLKDMDQIKNLPMLVMMLEDIRPELFVDGVDVERKPDPDLGLPEGFMDEDTEFTLKYGEDFSKMPYQHFWRLDGQGADFDPEKAFYRWRGRPYHNDTDDVIEEFKQHAGWYWRIFTVPVGNSNPRPTRRC